MADDRPETLERRLNRVARRLTRNTEALMTAVVEDIGRELVPATPVDTGFARANWRPSLNAPATTPVSFLDPTGSATIARIDTVAKRFRIGDEAWIVNRAPYIGNLNAGSSPQAPPDFVRDAARRGVDKAFDRFGIGVPNRDPLTGRIRARG